MVCESVGLSVDSASACKLFPHPEQRLIDAGVALKRRHVFDGIGMMLLLIPRDKVIDPTARCLNLFKRFTQIGGAAFRSSDQNLSLRITLTLSLWV